MTDFPMRLRRAREARGINVTELDRLADVGRGMVTRIEKGLRENVSAWVVKSLAEALDVSVDWLLGRGPVTIPETATGPFLMALDQRRLRAYIEKHPLKWRVTTVLAALDADVPCDQHGVPDGGWPRLLDTIEAGNFPVRADARPMRRLPRG